jgi:hypothetical protein
MISDDTAPIAPHLLMEEIGRVDRYFVTEKGLMVQFGAGEPFSARIVPNLKTPPIAKVIFEKIVAPWAVKCQNFFQNFVIERIHFTLAPYPLDEDTQDIAAAFCRLEEDVLASLEPELPRRILINAARTSSSINDLDARAVAAGNFRIPDGAWNAATWFHALGAWAAHVNFIQLAVVAQRLTSHEKLARSIRRQPPLP